MGESFYNEVFSRDKKTVFSNQQVTLKKDRDAVFGLAD